MRRFFKKYIIILSQGVKHFLFFLKVESFLLLNGVKILKINNLTSKTRKKGVWTIEEGNDFITKKIINKSNFTHVFFLENSDIRLVIYLSNKSFFIDITAKLLSRC